MPKRKVRREIYKHRIKFMHQGDDNLSLYNTKVEEFLQETENGYVERMVCDNKGALILCIGWDELIK